MKNLKIFLKTRLLKPGLLLLRGLLCLSIGLPPMAAFPYSPSVEKARESFYMSIQINNQQIDHAVKSLLQDYSRQMYNKEGWRIAAQILELTEDQTAHYMDYPNTGPFAVDEYYFRKKYASLRHSLTSSAQHYFLLMKKQEKPFKIKKQVYENLPPPYKVHGGYMPKNIHASYTEGGFAYDLPMLSSKRKVYLSRFYGDIFRLHNFDLHYEHEMIRRLHLTQFYNQYKNSPPGSKKHTRALSAVLGLFSAEAIAYYKNNAIGSSINFGPSAKDDSGRIDEDFDMVPVFTANNEAENCFLEKLAGSVYFELENSVNYIDFMMRFHTKILLGLASKIQHNTQNLAFKNCVRKSRPSIIYTAARKLRIYHNNKARLLRSKLWGDGKEFLYVMGSFAAVAATAAGIAYASPAIAAGINSFVGGASLKTSFVVEGVKITGTSAAAAGSITNETVALSAVGFCVGLATLMISGCGLYDKLQSGKEKKRHNKATEKEQKRHNKKQEENDTIKNREEKRHNKKQERLMQETNNLQRTDNKLQRERNELLKQQIKNRSTY